MKPTIPTAPSMPRSPTFFPTDTEGLPEALATRTIDLADGEEVDLVLTPVRKRVGDNWIRMLAYNGSVPGPTLRIPQGAKVTARVRNLGDGPTTVHWHGLRLTNRWDGTQATQAPIAVGGTFTYQLEVPDPGAYWYHPHVREDYGQEMGLYGSMVVVPSDGDYWPPAHREMSISLDDLLIENGRTAPFSRDEINHVAMGRFGNTMLVSGSTDLALTARRGEVIRLFLVNTANTRFFKVAIPGARMKLVGGDSGRVEREALVDTVLLAPSERAIVDVLFDQAGELEMVNESPERTYPLARISVSDEPADGEPTARFATLRRNDEWAVARDELAAWMSIPPAKTVAFVAERNLPAATEAAVHGLPSGQPAKASSRLEWEDDMEELNRNSTPASMHWKLIDVATGNANSAIDWRFRVGDRVKLRLVNPLDSDHPMPHPFHVHGAGRFVVLAREGVAEKNLVWKDTVLVQTGETVDLLLELTNPGIWMAHCHIAEHHEGGMMFQFEVTPAARGYAVAGRSRAMAVT